MAKTTYMPETQQEYLVRDLNLRGSCQTFVLNQDYSKNMYYTLNCITIYFC